ncbi:hypothetical protein ACFOWM_06150 [Ferruginibacter yonginensis]|uniref:Uncharacterized protein n=1 Tax=Ferruginibacter yonginensis TaxID=1310416 RepID=A0ABV8QS01_9BACT
MDVTGNDKIVINIISYGEKIKGRLEGGSVEAKSIIIRINGKVVYRKLHTNIFLNDGSIIDASVKNIELLKYDNNINDRLIMPIETKESTSNGGVLDDDNDVTLRSLIDMWCVKIHGNNDEALEKANNMFEAARKEFYKNEKPLFPPDRIEKHSSI